MNHNAEERSLDRRRAGVLLHMTSLPGPGATGDLGPEARRFVDFLSGAGLTVWQMLPIGPTQADGSPYQSSSMHAGNPRLISLAPLVEAGLLEPSWLERHALSDDEKGEALVAAWRNFRRGAQGQLKGAFEQFVGEQNHWLEEYALYRAIHRERDGNCWWDWPAPLRDREPQAMALARARLADEIDFARFEQFQFFRQWLALKHYANERGVRLFGDMPIFVAHDSAEVWARRAFFQLDAEGHPTVVAGVPPDYFSETGQRWGNPLYDWGFMEEHGFAFWIERLQTQLLLFDLVRIDHFRGFEAYWEIPARDETAINGRWIEAPGDALFQRLHEIYDPLPVVAEDLGIITPEVERLRDTFGLPGMKILQFAFSGDPDNPYLPFRHVANSVVYTGTHDNDTTLGWYTSLDDGQRRYVDEFFGYSQEVMPWPLIRSALASRARLAILPMQDILSLDGSHRMNLPGTTEGNWQWRFEWSQVDEDLAERLRRRVEMYGRASN